MNRLKLFLTLLIGVSLLLSFLALTENSSVQAQSANVPVTGWAWSSNIGWIKMAGDKLDRFPWENPVTYNSETGDVSGYAWSSNIGWIDFSNVQGNSDGSITGSAKALAANGSGWDGEIWMSGNKTNGDPWEDPDGIVGVRIDNNQVKGFAWGGPVVGWVKFDGLFSLGDDPENPECTGTCIDGPTDPTDSKLTIGITGSESENEQVDVSYDGNSLGSCVGNGSFVQCVYDIPTDAEVLITSSIIPTAWLDACSEAIDDTCQFTKTSVDQSATIQFGSLTGPDGELFDVTTTNCIVVGGQCMIVISCLGNSCPLGSNINRPVGGVQLSPLSDVGNLSWTVSPQTLSYNNDGQVDLYFCPSPDDSQLSNCSLGSYGPFGSTIYLFAHLENRTQVNLVKDVEVTATSEDGITTQVETIKVRYIDSNIGQSFLPN